MMVNISKHSIKRTKDETSDILKKFITEIENLKDYKVKIIRCDNGGEFRNKEMNDFCSQKGIKREFSNARTPQQNGVAEKRNRTLIEVARTMVLVNKSQNKTPYELFNGRAPAIGFLKPFGCHVMILNTLDNLGKFEAKGDEGYFIGYSMSSKAFRVFNKRTRRVEENLHVEFLENKAIEQGAGPNWLFDIVSLTKFMNYVPVDAGNISYLSNFEPFDGGYVSFGQGGCKITGKGTIKTDSECIVLGRNFKLLDDTNILLRTPRQHNMYSIDLNNIVPHKDLTCLVAKASADECILWHRRLGKQHKASCKSKLVNSVTKPLHTLHMDLFGPTSVSSISHKWYCLVMTDDFSRFTWTFFLGTKDETSDILKKFITEIENLKDYKVKIIRCDNGGEFRNKEMNDFCSQKGIKREFSNARTPQQNGVAERRNRTLIEAARTMLADAKLPVTFWAEAVNTACYVQNRVKSSHWQNKFPLPVKFVATARRLEMPLPEACTAIEEKKKKMPVKDRWQYKRCSKTRKTSSEARLVSKRVSHQEESPSLDNILSLTSRFDDILRVSISSDETIGVEVDVSNMETSISASPTPTLRIHKDHLKSQIIGPVDTPIQTRHKSKMVEEQNEEVYVMQPPRFHDPEYPTRVYKVEKAMYGLHQAARA
nr:hypothetical protein [Tanacetum cinerariifolium]